MTLTLAVIAVAFSAAALAFTLSAVRGLPDPIDPAAEERALIGWLGRRRRLQRFLGERLDRRSAGGLTLTLVLLVFFTASVLVGLLLDMITASSGLASLDDTVAQWGAGHADSAAAVDLFTAVTYFGDTVVVLAAMLIAGVLDFVRRRRAEVFLFLGIAIVGEKILVNGLKAIVNRERPDLMQLVAWDGSSFPSGHTAAAAVAWPAIALVLGRGRRRVVRAVLASVAALLTIAVATSRALLGVHWLTDVVAGLAIGYGWFLICAVMFGGRAQRLGDPVTSRRRSRI